MCHFVRKIDYTLMTTPVSCNRHPSETCLKRAWYRSTDIIPAFARHPFICLTDGGQSKESSIWALVKRLETVPPTASTVHRPLTNFADDVRSLHSPISKALRPGLHFRGSDGSHVGLTILSVLSNRGSTITLRLAVCTCSICQWSHYNCESNWHC